MRFADLKNVRLGILGLGREGQAVWRQIRQRFPDKALSLYSESAIDPAFCQGLDPSKDDCLLGPMDIDTLKHHDVLVRSAGISPYRPELQKLRSLGVQFTTASNLWFAEHPDARTICISGTLGKSTTATLLAHLLERAGIKTCLAGNIGKPMLDCVSPDVDWWVIELSSYQISDLEASPDIAVLLNLSEDHLDWHKGLKGYRSDKLKLANLAINGQLIANYSDRTLRAGLKNHPNISWFNQTGSWQAESDHVYRQHLTSADMDVEAHTDPCRRIETSEALHGAHNMQNLAAALTVVDVLGLQVPNLDEALSSFAGLPHRLQFIGEKAGVRYFNDSISTTPLSVAAALQTLGNKDVVLLLGGMDRGLDWGGFVKDVGKFMPFAVVAMPDNGPVIVESIKHAGGQPKGGMYLVPGLEEAVILARSLVPENGCILLSPGAPSFPHFNNFEDRGEQFRRFAGLNIGRDIEK